LEASELSFDAKHPVLLPYNDPIVKLIFEKIHIENMICGAQTLLATSRQRYWAIKAKTISRNVILKCVKCARAKPKLITLNLKQHSANEESYMICHLGPHHLRACSRFQEMDPKTRRQAIIQVGACTNCLSTAHKVENCGSQATCRVCQQRHHSLLHHGATSNPVAGAATITGYDNPRGYALLRQGPTGQLQTCRAVTNAGSQVNLISRRMANLLSLKDMSSPIEIYGIGGKTTTAIRSILKLSSCPSGLKH